MSRRWLSYLLIVSLAFNLAVLGVFVFVTATGKPLFPPPPPDRDEQMPHPQKSIRPQNKWMADCMRDGMNQCQPYREDFFQERKAFIDALRNEDFKPEAAKQQLEKSLKAHTSMERALGQNLIEMRMKMTDQQAKQFFDKRFDHKKKLMNKLHNRRNP